MSEQPKREREQTYDADGIAGILKQIASRRIRATIELRHDGSGKDLFTFYFTKINAADLALK